VTVTGIDIWEPALQIATENVKAARLADPCHHPA